MNEIKEMLSFIFSLAEAIDKSVADGKISIADVPSFIDPIMKAQAAFMGLDKIKAEMQSMDEAKKAELMEWAKEEFDLENDRLEYMIENGLSIGMSLANLLFKIKG